MIDYGYVSRGNVGVCVCSNSISSHVFKICPLPEDSFWITQSVVVSSCIIYIYIYHIYLWLYEGDNRVI